MIGFLVFILTAVICVIAALAVEEFPDALDTYRKYREEVSPYKRSKVMPKLTKGYRWRIKTIESHWTDRPKSIRVSIESKNTSISREQEIPDQLESPEILAELIAEVYEDFKRDTFVDDGLKNALNYYKGNKPKAIGRKQDRL